MNGSRPLSSPPPNWPSMRRRCRCSIPGAARPRPATSGRSRVMTGPGAEPTRRLSPIPTRRGEAASISRNCSQTIAASCSAMAMPLTRSCRRRGSQLPFAGATCGVNSSRSPSAAMRLSPLKPWRIAQIYVFEKDVRATSADERRVARQARSRPLADALRIFFEHQLARLSGGSDTARIIRYGLRHWDGLTRFLDDGRIELDTNIVERSMRPQALTRKNALFAGHDDGAENWAIVASLIEACKLNDVEPQAYLADVLVRLVNLWPNNRLDELLPWTWAAARQQHQRAAA